MEDKTQKKIKKLQSFKADKEEAKFLDQVEATEKLGEIAEAIQNPKQKVIMELAPMAPDEFAVQMWSMLRGKKGEDGKTPSKSELETIIKPLIPAPLKGKDGETPSESTLISLIKPLIPAPEKGNDGKTPSKDELVAVITPLIPKAKEIATIFTLEKIVEKLAKAKGENRLDYNALKNTPDLAREISKLGRGGSNIEAFLNGTKVGSGQAINLAGTGITASSDGHMTTFNISG